MEWLKFIKNSGAFAFKKYDNCCLITGYFMLLSCCVNVLYHKWNCLLDGMMKIRVYT